MRRGLRDLTGDAVGPGIAQLVRCDEETKERRSLTCLTATHALPGFATAAMPLAAVVAWPAYCMSP